MNAVPEPRSVTGRPIASCWRLIAVNMACTCAVVRSAGRICPGHGAAAADAAAAPVQRWRQLQRQVPASVSFRAAQRAPRTHPPAAGLVAAPAPAAHASLCIHGGPLLGSSPAPGHTQQGQGRGRAPGSQTATSVTPRRSSNSCSVTVLAGCAPVRGPPARVMAVTIPERRDGEARAPRIAGTG